LADQKSRSSTEQWRSDFGLRRRVVVGCDYMLFDPWSKRFVGGRSESRAVL